MDNKSREFCEEVDVDMYLRVHLCALQCAAVCICYDLLPYSESCLINSRLITTPMPVGANREIESDRTWFGRPAVHKSQSDQ